MLLHARSAADGGGAPAPIALHLDKTAQYTNTIHEFYSLYDDEHGIGKIVILALPLFNTPPFPIAIASSIYLDFLQFMKNR